MQESEMIASSQPMISEAECTIISSCFLCWAVQLPNHIVIENLSGSIERRHPRNPYSFWAGAEKNKSLYLKLSYYFRKEEIGVPQNAILFPLSISWPLITSPNLTTKMLTGAGLLKQQQFCVLIHFFKSKSCYCCITSKLARFYILRCCCLCYDSTLNSLQLYLCRRMKCDLSFLPPTLFWGTSWPLHLLSYSPAFSAKWKIQESTPLSLELKGEA